MGKYLVFYVDTREGVKEFPHDCFVVRTDDVEQAIKDMLTAQSCKETDIVQIYNIEADAWMTITWYNVNVPNEFPRLV